MTDIEKWSSRGAFSGLAAQPSEQRPTLLQLLAASALIETIEKQCSDGIHSEQEEMRLRRVVVQACRAFGLSTLGERDYNLVVNLVHQEMRAPA